MNVAAVRTAGRYLGVWVAITLFVSLVSFTFTFLGTITSAVLAGIMMGGFKGSKCFSVLVSLVFPAVVFGMTRNARTELSSKQILLLALLCFGTFWGTYLVSAFMLFCEQKGRKPATTSPGVSVTATLARGQATDATATGEIAGDACLEQLQGTWACEDSSPHGSQLRKVLQITGNNLELKAVDLSGRTTVVGHGKVALQALRSRDEPELT